MKTPPFLTIMMCILPCTTYFLTVAKYDDEINPNPGAWEKLISIPPSRRIPSPPRDASLMRVWCEFDASSPNR